MTSSADRPAADPAKMAAGIDPSTLTQVGWIYTYPDPAKEIPPVLSLRRLNSKCGWSERAIYAQDLMHGISVEADQ